MTGIQRYSNTLTTKEISERSGLDVANLRAAIRGNRGLSMKAARQVAPLFDAEPLSLYVESQCRAIKAKLEKGEGKAAVLRAVAAVHDELKALSRQELTDAGKELTAAVEELKAVAEQALEADDEAPDVPARDKAAKKSVSRDADGRRVREPENPVLKSLRDSAPHLYTNKTFRDAAGRVVREPEGVERDGFGKRVRTER